MMVRLMVLFKGEMMVRWWYDDDRDDGLGDDSMLIENDDGGEVDGNVQR